MAVTKPCCTALPFLQLCDVSESQFDGSTILKVADGRRSITYFSAPFGASEAELERDDGVPIRSIYWKFPIILHADGQPWSEACLFLIELAQAQLEPQMHTLRSNAGDLANFAQFLHEEKIDWRHFGQNPSLRPTNRFRGFLKQQVNAGHITSGVANRRINVVIRYYEWLIEEGRIRPSNPPWVSKITRIRYIDGRGQQQEKDVRTTNLRIHVNRTKVPGDEYIEDGGKLRPLVLEEQRAILRSLYELGNTEVTLMHLIALMTGAREQTVLTLRLKHVSRDLSTISGSDIRIKCGPGTGIDTKYATEGELRMPVYLYRCLQVYANSDRAKRRREKNGRGDTDDQFLFLTSHGKSFYESKEEQNGPDATGALLKSSKTGQSLRTFITRRVLPLARSHLGRVSFRYRFHDLRATFGMNYLDFHLSRESDGVDYSDTLLGELQRLMWHRSIATTLYYLNYRRVHRYAEAGEEEWLDYLRKLMPGRI
jgi:hypothetical protein